MASDIIEPIADEMPHTSESQSTEDMLASFDKYNQDAKSEALLNLVINNCNENESDKSQKASPAPEVSSVFALQELQVCCHPVRESQESLLEHSEVDCPTSP